MSEPSRVRSHFGSRLFGGGGGALYLGSVLCAMPSAIDLAKRALVSLLRTFAAAYGVALTLKRDAPDREVSGAYRKVSLKTHPDRGGKAGDQTSLNNAHDAWEAAKKARKPPGGKRNRNQQDKSGEASALFVIRLISSLAIMSN